MTVGDLPELIEVQREGAITGLAAVFTQEKFPFPRNAVLARWRDELADPSVEAYVAVDSAGRIVGFAATREAELMHFGTAVATWGSGTASVLLDKTVALLRADGVSVPVLRVFADNGRAIRFYEKHGWVPTGATSVSSFEPYPVLLEYALPHS